MAIEVGSAYVSLVPSARGFGAASKRLLSGELSGTGAAVGQELGDSIGSNAEPAMSRRMRGAFTAFVGLAATAGVAAGAALGALGGFGLKAAGELQQTEIAFEGILQSGEKAQAFLETLRDFAAKTPFEFPELARSAKNLLAVGFNAEEVIPIMTTLGNVAATLGVGGDAIEGVVRALGQMQGKGKASAEELNQISEQIPGFSAVGAIAKSMGITVAEVFQKLQDGAIPADAAIRAILDGMKQFPGAAGAMERQSATLLGVFSTFKDTFRDALVGGITPALPVLSGALQQIIPSLEGPLGEIGAKIGGILQAAVPVLEKALPVIEAVFGVVGGVILDALEAVTSSGLLDALGSSLAQIGAALSPLIAALVDGLAPILTALVTALGPLIAALAGALTPIINALAPILERLAFQLAAIIVEVAKSGLFETLGKVLGRLVEAAAPLLEIIGDLVTQGFEALKPILPLIGNALERLAPIFERLIESLRPVARELGEALITALKSILPVLPALVDAFLELVVALVPLVPSLVKLTTQWVKLLPVIAPLVVLLAEGLTLALTAVAKALDLIVPLVTPLIPLLAGPFPGAILVVKLALDGLREAIDWLRRQWDEHWPAIRAALESAWQAMQPIFDAIKSALGAVADAAGWLRDRWVEIWPTISGALQTAWGVAQSIFNDFKTAVQGIGDTAKWLGDNAKAWFDNVVIGAQSLWDAVAGPLNAFWNILKNIYNTIKNIIDAIPGIPGISNLTGGMSIDEALAAAQANAGLAVGGIVTRPTFTLIGEGGEPEAVIPLSNLERMVDKVWVAGATTAAVPATGREIVFHQTFVSRDPERDARNAARAARTEMRLVGL